MRAQKPWTVEPLEQRELLSGVSYSLTTDRSVYQVGQPIQMTFTETNSGNQPVTVQLEPTDFIVSLKGNAIWQSNQGSTAQTTTTESLQPGQSITQSASWDGTTYYAPAAMSVDNVGSFSVSNPNAPSGTAASFQITNPITTSLTTESQVYQIGQPVQMTFTEINAGSVPFTGFVQTGGFEFAFYQNGKPVESTIYPLAGIWGGPSVLNPGQVITDTQTLNVIPDSGPFTLDHLTGTFDAVFGPDNDPTEYSTPFQVVAPSPDTVVTSVTTDRSTYTPGQIANLTFSETNHGTESIAVLTGQSSFQISQSGTVVENAIQGPSGPILGQELSFTNLWPGQTYSQTVTWNTSTGFFSQHSQYGTFMVTDDLDPDADTASFQIVPPVTAHLLANHTSYQPGQTVRLTMTLENNSPANISVASNPKVDDITVVQGSTVVYRSGAIVFPLSTRSIKSNSSTKLTLAWSGHPNQVGVKKLTPGTYTILVVEGGYSATTSIHLVSRS